MADPLLRAEGISHFYGPKLIFKKVSLAVEPGEVWLVVGPNGAGKSTLLSILAGLKRPRKGRIERRVDRARIGYLGHATFHYDKLSARDNLAFWARMYGVADAGARIDEMLERVGLTRAAAEPAGKFSRGMAQRLALARVFLAEPKIIFLDEPATGLDARSQGLLRREMETATQGGAALVWVSHMVREDLKRADKVLHIAGKTADYCGDAAGYEPGGDVC
jgi:heme exporter protein A